MDFVGDFAGDDFTDASEQFDDLSNVTIVMDEDAKEALSADEDLLFFEEMKDELVRLGYVITDDMDFESMQLLKDRVYDSLEKEDDTLRQALSAQRETLDDDLNSLRDGCATLLPFGQQDTNAENSYLASADATLGPELSNLIRNWVMNAVITGDSFGEEKSDAQIYQEMVEYHFDAPKLKLKEASVLRYIAAIRPLYARIHAELSHDALKHLELRQQVARRFIQEESENLDKLQQAKHLAFIRQVYDLGDGTYETICPVCHKRVPVNGSAAKMMVYGTEKGTRKRMYFGVMQCNTPDCGTAFMLSKQEYLQLYKSFFSKCGESIDSFINKSKKECTGASILHSDIPIGVLKDDVGYLFLQEGTRQKESADDCAEKSVYLVVSDDEMMDAAKRFYFKLQGIPQILTPIKNYNDIKVESIEEGMNSLVADAAANEHYKSFTVGDGDWSYHDIAVMLTQCLSKEYYEEKNKALFTLVFFFYSNPFLKDALDSRGIWMLEDSIAFVKEYATLKNPRILKSNEVAELRNALMLLNEAVSEKSEELLHVAHAALPRLEKLLEDKRNERLKVISDLKRYEDMLSSMKMNRISSCKLSDLVSLVSDNDFAIFLNRVSDRIIIHTYAEEFCDYWKNFSDIKANHVDKICDLQSDSSATEKSLKKLCELGHFSEKALMRMRMIYDRQEGFAELMKKLNSAFVSTDYYQFCKCVCDIPHVKIPQNCDEALLVQFCSNFLSEACRVVNNGKVITMLERDFKEEEILGCRKCNELLFGRYVLKRLPGESIEEYCDRCLAWDGALKPDLAVYDNYALFESVKKYGVFLSLCATLYNAEYSSFGKNVFMSSILYNTVDTDRVSSVLKISKMQQNIIKTVKPDVMYIPQGDKFCRVLYGIYMSSISTLVNAEMNTFGSTVVKISDSGDSLRGKCELSELLKKLFEYAETAVDEEGEVVQDGLIALHEMSVYAGIPEDSVTELISQ